MKDSLKYLNQSKKNITCGLDSAQTHIASHFAFFFHFENLRKLFNFDLQPMLCMQLNHFKKQIHNLKCDDNLMQMLNRI